MALSMRVNGIPHAISFLNTKKRDIGNGITDGVVNAAETLRKEVKASIQGKKAEPRSVDTGAFLNSINIMTSKDSASVTSEMEYAKYLEYGTAYIPERRHFRNSMARNRQKLADDIESSIKKKL